MKILALSISFMAGFAAATLINHAIVAWWLFA